MRIFNIYKIYKRYKKIYKNTLCIMWSLYKKRDFINVVFKDGTSQKISSELASTLPYIVNNIKYNEGLKEKLIELYNIVQKYETTSVQLRDLLHLINNGVEFSDAMDIMKNIIEIRLNEKIPYKNKNIIMYGLKDNGDLIDVFIWEDYKFLNVNNKIVIDIGANIGDSAIYFALNGAKKVIALEPYPHLFNLATKNVKENNLEGQIEILNAGYGKDGEIFVDEDVKADLGTILKSSGNGKPIRIYSLESLVKIFSLENAVLKMDCEGCEYNLLNEDNSIIRKFSQIQIEYHYGYKKLVKKLNKAGFQVEYVNREGSEKFGLIYAKRTK
jgi:FkbM family methyltransferase